MINVFTQAITVIGQKKNIYSDFWKYKSRMNEDAGLN